MGIAFGAIRRRVFGLDAKAVDFQHRGFQGADARVRIRLELVGGAFLAGYHSALECQSIPELAATLKGVELELRGFAFEGAAMGLALLDLLTPWRCDRVGRLLRGAGDAHTYMIQVGIGWVWARAPFGFRRWQSNLNPLLGWLAYDGWGFHEGLFHSPKYLAAIAVCYLMARFPCLSAGDCTKLAANFKFDKLPLPEVTNHPPYKYVRAVHPSLSRISAWISTLGTAAAMEDLDGDGLPNDLIYSDPRTDLVTVAPVAGTGNRYLPFVLDPAPLPYDSATMAPMGIVVGDFNEDANLPLGERAGHPGVDLHGRPAVCAQALVKLPDGRKLVSQVDGGSGHASGRSREIHLGLGKVDPGAKLDVQVTWRDLVGQFQQTTLKLAPVWHTVVLGKRVTTQTVAMNGGAAR